MFEESRNKSIITIIGGIFFGVAWWIFIDAAGWADYVNDTNTVTPISAKNAFPTIGMTISIVLLNAVDWTAVNEGQSAPRVIFGLSIAACMACFIGACFVLYEYTNTDSGSVYPGAAVFVSSILIFLSGLIARAARRDTF